MSGPVHYHYGKFPPSDLNWERLIPYIGPASGALARYDGMLSAIPNASVLMSPLITQEAVLSSRIEGTQATMGEVLEFEAEGESGDVSPERRNDINEVLNYRKAMWKAVDRLEEFPLCQRVIREAHEILLDGVRGAGKSPGEYRKTPNWIGPAGCTMEKARFVPISADKLPAAMGAWEQYINGKVPDRLVQLAILHAEFESLHPFLDGNGRLGRMCVPLFLYKVGLIQSPVFYISAFFEANRDEYYDRLLAVSRDNAWTQWCIFFLKAVEAQANDNLEKTKAILNLYDDKKRQIHELAHSQYAIHALDFIFVRPIFRSSTFMRDQNISPRTAKRILGSLRDHGILRVIRVASGRRSAIYAFGDLINIAEGKGFF